MQEEVDSKTIALAISTTKLTGRVLKSAITKFLEQKKGGGTKLRHGKQTVRQLVGQNQGVANIEITDKNIKDFERVARFSKCAWKLGHWVDVVWMQKILHESDDAPEAFVPFPEIAGKM